MPIAATQLLTRASIIAEDESFVRWTKAEWLQWANDAAAAAIVIRPAVRAVAGVLTLAAGTKQELPANAVQLLDVVRNLAANGTTPGRIVRRVDRQLMDDIDPDWHTKRAAAAIKHFMFDERAPKTFYCYPAANAGIKVEALYSELPPEITAEGDTLDIGLEHLNVLLNYMLYRAYGKDSEYANGAMSVAYYQAFAEGLTGAAAQTTANSPNQNSV